MLKYIMKRLVLMIFTFLIITTICFVLIKMLPVKQAVQFGKDQALIEQRREQLGYNEPMIVQYGLFLKNSLLGMDWGIGEEMYKMQEVWDVFTSKLPSTMLVNVYAMIFSVPIGLLLGIFAALKKNKWQDHLISTGVMIFVSVPSFIYAFLVQYLFCFKLDWFPLISAPGTDYFSWEMFVSLVPAIMSLGFGTVAGLARYTRAELTEVLTNDFMLLARTKGLTKAQATARHAMRNAMVVILPMIIGEFIGIIGGSLIIEGFFNIPGVGALYIDSITARDYNFFMLLSCFYTLIGLLSNIVIDISYGFIDPRIKMGEK